jgi:hypothetical protein
MIRLTLGLILLAAAAGAVPSLGEHGRTDRGAQTRPI